MYIQIEKIVLSYNEMGSPNIATKAVAFKGFKTMRAFELPKKASQANRRDQQECLDVGVMFILLSTIDWNVHPPFNYS